ncbi:uncharacterized protein LOC142521999 [Primulina tabacum]|uniref:uncharacterized protein LOC142521999 n=1 Tax=Primulina tabacum TaxID=48773 RepID=UPI003F5AC079
MRASYPSTTEELSFSVNRTTDSNGMYKLELASFDCAVEFQYSFCVANLIGISSDSDCSVPAQTTTSATDIAHNNVCAYTLGALSYQPETINVTLCGGAKN